MLYQSSNVEFIWSALKSAISTAVSLFTPMRMIHNGSHPAWFNSGIRHKINQLNTLRRKKSSSSCLSKISVLEAQLRDNIISAKSQYESELVLNFSYSDSSKVFKYIKSFSKQSILPQVMSLNTSSAHTDEEKADLFNQFFFLFTLIILTKPLLQLPIRCLLSTTLTLMSLKYFVFLLLLTLPRPWALMGLVHLYLNLVLMFCVSLLIIFSPSLFLMVIYLLNGVYILLLQYSNQATNLQSGTTGLFLSF